MRTAAFILLLIGTALPSCATRALWGKTGNDTHRDVTQVAVRHRAEAAVQDITFWRTEYCQQAIGMSYRYVSGELEEVDVPSDDRPYRLVMAPRSNEQKFQDLVTDPAAIEAISWEYRPDEPHPRARIQVGNEEWTGDVGLTWTEVEPEPLSEPTSALPVTIRQTTHETSYLQVFVRAAVTPITLALDVATVGLVVLAKTEHHCHSGCRCKGVLKLWK